MAWQDIVGSAFDLGTQALLTQELAKTQRQAGADVYQKAKDYGQTYQIYLLAHSNRLLLAQGLGRVSLWVNREMCLLQCLSHNLLTLKH